MSTLKQRMLRRVRNQELAAADRANRCVVCFLDLRPLLKVYTTLAGEKYYSRACMDQALGMAR